MSDPIVHLPVPRPPNDPAHRFDVRFVGDAPNPQGTTNSIRRTVHISHGSEWRELEFVVTSDEIGSAGIPADRMRDPLLWRTAIAAIEAELDANYECIADIPSELGGFAQQLRAWIA